MLNNTYFALVFVLFETLKTLKYNTCELFSTFHSFSSLWLKCYVFSIFLTSEITSNHKLIENSRLINLIMNNVVGMGLCGFVFHQETNLKYHSHIGGSMFKHGEMAYNRLS